MDSLELREHLDEVTPDTPYYELLILDFDTDRPAWWACNLCGRDLDGQPCPDHAPQQVPGLSLVDCEASPRHWVWTLDGEHNGYGNPCPECRLAEYYERDRLARQCRHWPWRRWKATHWFVGKLYTLGIVSSGGSWKLGDGCRGCMDWLPRLRGRRPYVLGVQREVWRCWSRGHRRGEEVGFGFCGKCVPWPCCGSQQQAHIAGCPEDDTAAVAR